MKNISKFILATIYILILFILAIWMFWQSHGKDYIEKYIDDQYGQYIIRASKDLIILKDSKSEADNDKGKS